MSRDERVAEDALAVARAIFAEMERSIQHRRDGIEVSVGVFGEGVKVRTIDGTIYRIQRDN